MQVVDVIRRFSKTPLKHRMSKYLLEYIIDNKELLNRIRIVTTRAFLPDTMLVAQAGAEGPSFELELGAIERDEVFYENGRLIKQTRKSRAIWVHDPVHAVEILRKFRGVLHVEFKFAGAVPDWYLAAVKELQVDDEKQEEVARLIREQIDLLISGILLKDEIDKALAQGDQQQFREKVQKYKKICSSCLWDF